MKKELALILLLLSGCASTPISFQQAKEAPKERVFNTTLSNEANLGKIVILRDNGFPLSGCPFLISLNNQPLASIQNDEKITFYVDEQEQSISLGMDGDYSSFCSTFYVKTFDSLETTVKPNEVKYWRVERERFIRDYPKN